MPPYPVLRTHRPAASGSTAQPRPVTSIGGAGGEGGEGGGIGGDGGGDGRVRNSLIPAPPMRKRLGVCSSALAERAMESTSAAARSISLTRATKSVGPCASIWAATPETCGVAMLVPLMVLVAVLLEPTHAPGMSEPGACAHARRGLRVAAGGRAAGGRWRANMHGWARGGRGGGLRPARGRTRRSWRSRRHRRCRWWSQRVAC